MNVIKIVKDEIENLNYVRIYLTQGFKSAARGVNILDAFNAISTFDSKIDSVLKDMYGYSNNNGMLTYGTAMCSIEMNRICSEGENTVSFDLFFNSMNSFLDELWVKSRNNPDLSDSVSDSIGRLSYKVQALLDWVDNQDSRMHDTFELCWQNGRLHMFEGYLRIAVDKVNNNQSFDAPQI